MLVSQPQRHYPISEGNGNRGGSGASARGASGVLRYPFSVTTAPAASPAIPTTSASTALEQAASLIGEVPDYPEAGILFRDITPLLADGEALRVTVDALLAPFTGTFDVIAGIEARGFILASAAAIAAGTGVVPIRKAGKLPRPAASIDYALEYGTATIEMHADLAPGTRVLVIDDVLATGGTLAAALDMLQQLGYEVAGTAVLFEIAGLGGRETVGDPHLHTVFHS
ncbi:MAG: adenine phosphoribosyltransferase [Actinobacteria bacterium]|nr:adenine phosphoribosyltransferase [Actinomycetota bacterium]